METTPAHILEVLKRRTTVLNTVILIITPLAMAVGGYFWYKNNIWRPDISLVSTDWVNNTAEVMINGTQRKLYAGSTNNAGYGWGVRFSGAVFNEYDRIEVVKNDLTYKTLSTKA